jgi:hypothetical protein
MWINIVLNLVTYSLHFEVVEFDSLFLPGGNPLTLLLQGAAEIVRHFKILVTFFSARVSRSAGA